MKLSDSARMITVVVSAPKATMTSKIFQPFALKLRKPRPYHLIIMSPAYINVMAKKKLPIRENQKH